MRFWFDTEFAENGEVIKFISIGIVREDGAEYYAVDKDFDPNDANDWVKENVLTILDHPDFPGKLPGVYKSRAQIAQDVQEFSGNSPEFWAYCGSYDWVVLCQLFGTMMDLPKGWPYHPMDISQSRKELGVRLPRQKSQQHNALNDARWTKQAWEYIQQQKVRSLSQIMVGE